MDEELLATHRDFLQDAEFTQLLDWKHEDYRAARTRISTRTPTARAYLSMVLNVGRVRAPLSGRHTALFVVHILAVTSSCVMPAAVRAATRSATRSCNVRSRASDGECLAARELASNAMLSARASERSFMGRYGGSFRRWFAKMLTR
jgi:hypothetical protein